MFRYSFHNIAKIALQILAYIQQNRKCNILIFTEFGKCTFTCSNCFSELALFHFFVYQ